MDRPLSNTNTLSSLEPTIVRPDVQSSAAILSNIDPLFSLDTNQSNDLTILNIDLLVKGFRQTSFIYNLGMSFPNLNNQKIYFPFKTFITIDDLYKTLEAFNSYDNPTKTQLITLFTTPDLISQVILNAKERIASSTSGEDYKNYNVQTLNQAIQKGIIKNNLNLLNDILFLNESKISINNKKYLIEDSKELKPQLNDFKSQLEKNTPIKSILKCNGIIFISPIFEEKKVITSVTRLKLNLIIRGQRKGLVQNYDIGMSYPSLKGKTIYFPFTIKLSKKDLIKALDLSEFVKPTNNDLMSVFTKPGLLRLAIKNAIKSGESSVNTIEEAINKDIIKNNLELINTFLFDPKSNITIYGHIYTIHSSEGIVPEINKFKNDLISGKAPLSIKLQCNVILNILDSASPSDLEFKKLSCSMRKDLIIQDLEELLGTEIERDIKKDIKYLKRAPAISRWDYYKKKGVLYPDYYPQFYPPYYPGYQLYQDQYEDKYKTRKVRKPITESIFRKGPISTSVFTTRPFSTASTLDTFTSPDKISSDRFEDIPKTQLEKELERRKLLEKQSSMYPYPYPYQYGMFPPGMPVPYLNIPPTSKSLLTRKKTSPAKRKTKQITDYPYKYPYAYPYAMPTYTIQNTRPKLKKNILNETKKTINGGKKKKHNKTKKNFKL